MCFTTDHHLLDEDTVSSSRNITFICDEENDEMMITLLDQCIPWFKVKTIFFCDIDHRWFTKIENIIRDKSLVGNLKVFPCLQLEINQKTLEESKKQQDIEPMKFGIQFNGHNRLF